jgi:hypothetical protein
MEHPEQELARAHDEIRRLRRRIRRLQIRLGEAQSVPPDGLIWLFGSERGGTTWLATMMGERFPVWIEPWVGELFSTERPAMKNRRGKYFILAPHHRRVWLEGVRRFILDGAGARFPEVEDYLLVKEPHGSVGAPVLMSALPESRMVLLVRDPRDVAASALDAARSGSWRRERRRRMYGEDDPTADEDPDTFVSRQAEAYVRHVGGAWEAYQSHGGPKALVRYEDLRADTLEQMRHMYRGLELPVDEGLLAKAIEAHDWENIPQEDKGEGKFYRKATPGSWQEDLTPQQAKTVERICAPLLNEFFG